jgi:hypothetical protein
MPDRPTLTDFYNATLGEPWRIPEEPTGPPPFLSSQQREAVMRRVRNLQGIWFPPAVRRNTVFSDEVEKPFVRASDVRPKDPPGTKAVFHLGGRFTDSEGRHFDYVCVELIKHPDLPAKFIPTLPELLSSGARFVGRHRDSEYDRHEVGGVRQFFPRANRSMRPLFVDESDRDFEPVRGRNSLVVSIDVAPFAAVVRSFERSMTDAIRRFSASAGAVGNGIAAVGSALRCFDSAADTFAFLAEEFRPDGAERKTVRVYSRVRARKGMAWKHAGRTWAVESFTSGSFRRGDEFTDLHLVYFPPASRAGVGIQDNGDGGAHDDHYAGQSQRSDQDQRDQ